MKSIYALLLSFVTVVASGQLRVADEVSTHIKAGAKFTEVKPLVSSSAIDSSVLEVVKDAELATLNPTEIQKIMATKPSTIEVILPYKGQELAMQLYRVDPLADSFNLNSDQSTNISYTPGLYYRGIVKNELTSLASVNFFDNQFDAIVSSYTLSNLVVVPLDKPGNVSDYILYEDQNLLIENQSGCLVLEEEEKHSNFDPALARQVAESVGTASKCVKFYLEVDRDIYLNKGSNITQTTNWVTGLFNHMQTLFSNDNINVSLKSMFIWTTVDPYNGTNASMNLYRFKNNRPHFDGDLAQLIGVDAGNLGGVAIGVNTMCSTNNYAYSDINYSYNTVPTYSWTIQAITHEFGHMLGSPHTHSCSWNGNSTAIDNCGPVALPNSEGSNCKTTPSTLPSSTVKGTMMSYCHLLGAVGINFNNGFGEQPRNRIIQAINATTCVAQSCEVSCINGINNVRQTNATETSITIEWDDVSDSSTYDVKASLFNGTADWVVSNTRSVTLNDLQPNTYYKISIRPNCGSLSTYQRDYYFATAANWCGTNTIITDTGGLYANYMNSENTVRVIRPSQGNAIRIHFEAFNLENNMDFLRIYDGETTDAPLIGTYTGNTIPADVVATNETGALTLRLTSDPITSRAGYKAVVSCESSLSAGDYQTLQFSYYPNPARDIVHIQAASTIQKVLVYNLTGQLIKQQEVDQLQTQVSVNEFASGTYFFVVEAIEGKGQFKLVKI